MEILILITILIAAYFILPALKKKVDVMEAQLKETESVKNTDTLGEALDESGSNDIL